MPSTNLQQALDSTRLDETDAFLQSQIDSLGGGVQDQIDQINLEINTLQSEQTTQNNRLDGIDTDILGLDTDLTTAEGAITTLQNEQTTQNNQINSLDG